MQKRHILFLFCLMQGAAGFAQKYSNEFLTLGVGARAFGMSGAVAASVNDVTAAYWNPSGLLHMKDNLQVSLMHSEYFAGIANYDYGAVGFKLSDKSAMAFSLIRFGIDDIPNTLDLYKGGQINYNNIKSFSAVDYAFMASYAQKTKIAGLDLGGNVKIIRRTVGTFANAWGFGLDFGARYTYKKWDFGACAKDVTSTFNAWSYSFTDAEKQVLQQTGNVIPKNNVEITRPQLMLAAGRKLKVYKDLVGCRAESNMRLTFDGQRNVLISGNVLNVDPSLGLEFDYKNFAFLRSGVGNFQREKDLDGQKKLRFQPNIGVGFLIRSLQIDYALSDIGDQSAALYSHVFSLRLGINRKSNPAP